MQNLYWNILHFLCEFKTSSLAQIILATNIAESSVTIPKVGYVIDSCRSLQVYWDTNRKNDSAELVWVSKSQVLLEFGLLVIHFSNGIFLYSTSVSQAEQRKGRTGRTCDGHVYRLVTRLFFNQLVDYEPPAILRLSLRQQVLLICCAESRAINDPKGSLPFLTYYSLRWSFRCHLL